MAHIFPISKATSKPVYFASTYWFVGILASSLLANPPAHNPDYAGLESVKSNDLKAIPIALNSGDYIPVQGGDALEIQASFIVRFTNEPEVTEIAQNFRKDPAASQLRFAQWARQHRALRGLVLTSASYSGELILSLPANDPLNRGPSDVLKAIRAMESCAYAELDSVAYPSSGDR